MNNTPTLTSLLTRDLDAKSSGSSGRALLEMLDDLEVDLLDRVRPVDVALAMREVSPRNRSALEDVLAKAASTTELQLVALVGLAPDLEHAASRLSRGRPSQDVVGEVLAHATEALLWAHELSAGNRATFVVQHAFSRTRSERRNLARRSVTTECLSSATDVPEPPTDYHDEAQRRLDLALLEGVLDPAELDVINRTRAGGLSLRDVAESSHESYAALQRRRHRAEMRLRAYFGVREEAR